MRTLGLSLLIALGCPLLIAQPKAKVPAAVSNQSETMEIRFFIDLLNAANINFFISVIQGWLD